MQSASLSGWYTLVQVHVQNARGTVHTPSGGRGTENAAGEAEGTQRENQEMAAILTDKVARLNRAVANVNDTYSKVCPWNLGPIYRYPTSSPKHRYPRYRHYLRYRRYPRYIDVI